MNSRSVDSVHAAGDGLAARLHLPHARGRRGGERAPRPPARAQLARALARRTQLRRRALHRLHQELAADRFV